MANVARYITNQKGNNNLLDCNGYEYNYKNTSPNDERQYWNCKIAKCKAGLMIFIEVWRDISISLSQANYFSNFAHPPTLDSAKVISNAKYDIKRNGLIIWCSVKMANSLESF